MFTFPELELQRCATRLSDFVGGSGDGTQVPMPAWQALSLLGNLPVHVYSAC